MGEGAELFGAGDEVGFAAQLHQGADAAAGVDVGFHQALGGFAVGAFGGLFEALLAEGGYGLFQVAVVVLEGPLAVADAGAGLLAQGFD